MGPIPPPFGPPTAWAYEMGGSWEADRGDTTSGRLAQTALTEKTKLIISQASDARAVWTADNRSLYNSGMYGFWYECVVWANCSYGEDSMWEDLMPLYVDNQWLS